MSLFRLDIYSHNFAVSAIAPHIRPLIETFTRRYIQYGFGKTPYGQWGRIPVKTFATRTRDQSQYRYHINTLAAFRQFLNQNQIWDDQINTVKWDFHEPKQIELKLRDGWNDRPHQIPVIQYLIDKVPNGGPTKLVQLQMGKGKGYSAIKANTILSTLTVAMLRPQFITKWQLELIEKLEVGVEDIMIVRGGKALMALIELAVLGELETKFILVSNKTFQDYLKTYEELKEGILELGYGCLPHEFFETLGAGTRLMDEAHLDFHLNFKIDLYTHISNAASLSATLISDDDTITRMQEIAYPHNTRFDGGALDKYVDAVAVIYRFNHPNKIRCKDYARNSYSHNVFEQSISRMKDVEANYFRLIADVIRDGYIKNWKQGHRCLVYCASIDFATRLSNFLKAQFPQKDVRRYVEKDPYANLLEGEITVSTLLSAGTGHDIPGLTDVVLTVGVSSSTGNIQGFGRLRDQGDTKTRFYYLTSESIPKQVDYHQRKKELLKSRAASYRVEYYGRPI